MAISQSRKKRKIINTTSTKAISSVSSTSLIDLRILSVWSQVTSSVTSSGRVLIISASLFYFIRNGNIIGAGLRRYSQRNHGHITFFKDAFFVFGPNTAAQYRLHGYPGRRYFYNKVIKFFFGTYFSKCTNAKFGGITAYFTCRQFNIFTK